MKRAETYEEIAPLISLCREGKLFDVQEWIAEGKPVNPPLPPAKKARRRGPLQIAIDTGFHSLVKVLLESGKLIEEPRYNPLEHALQKRRFDLVKLLVEYGADIQSIGMEMVFDAWDPEIIEYFIAHGGDLETGNPLASALCSKIRPAIGVFKRHENRIPGLRKQVDIALRYHCREGSLKWVSLMLWAGGNPYAKGPSYPHEDAYEDPEDYESALGLAAFYGHTDVFKIKKIALDPTDPDANDLLWNACYSDDPELIQILLERGYTPRALEDKGTMLIHCLVSSMASGFDYYGLFRLKKDIDTSRSRDKMKILHMLVRHGAQWVPQDENFIKDLRRSLLKMKNDYIMEFIWIMSEYQACSRDSIEILIKTQTIRSIISKHTNRLNELIESLHPRET